MLEFSLNMLQILLPFVGKNVSICFFNFVFKLFAWKITFSLP